MHGVSDKRLPHKNRAPVLFTFAPILRSVSAILISSVIVITLTSPAAAQKNKKDKKDAAKSSDGQPMIPMSDEQQIDYMISSMLGAWQLGDIERMHQLYAADVMIVSGTWAPPVIGWANYAVLFQQQRARVQQVRMDRQNTYIKVDGNFGWACYQWDFAGTVDGQPMSSQGQTSLVVEKKNNRWLIVHNHTSVAQAPIPATPSNPGGNPASAPPTSQPQPAKPRSQ